MNIYHVTRLVDGDFDSYHGFICSAETGLRALQMHPDGGSLKSRDTEWPSDVADLRVALLGTSFDSVERVILAQYDAG